MTNMAVFTDQTDPGDHNIYKWEGDIDICRENVYHFSDQEGTEGNES